MDFEELLKLPSEEKLKNINDRLNFLESIFKDKQVSLTPKKKFIPPTPSTKPTLSE